MSLNGAILHLILQDVKIENAKFGNREEKTFSVGSIDSMNFHVLYCRHGNKGVPFCSFCEREGRLFLIISKKSSFFYEKKGERLMNERELREGRIRIPSGCAIAAVISREGRRMTGERIIESMRPMHERSNGLGGGFAGYGIYPDYKDFFALHLFYDDDGARADCESYLRSTLEIVRAENIPTRKLPAITDEPLIWRYFVTPLRSRLLSMQLDENEFVARVVMHINTHFPGAYVFSSGKNMGVFKAVGYPEEVGEFYRLEEYEAYSWTAHGRYPTNTPGWWGGAHPFALLERTIVHNGEISSYDANRRYIEMFGYKCTLQTDTEVITYIADYLQRKQGLTLEEVAGVIAAPFWSTIDRKPESERKKAEFLRTVFPSLLITGPFSIILGFEGGLMALNDRLKLRSMVVGEKDDLVFIASEEAAIRAMEPFAEHVWAPAGGQPVIVSVKEGAT